MRLISGLTSLSLPVLLLGLVACASSPKRPYSSQNNSNGTSSLQCQAAQANNTPPPAGCPQTTTTTGNAATGKRAPVIANTMPELPAMSLPPMPTLGRLR